MREETKVLDGTYGSQKTECDVLIYAHSVVGTWYVVDGGNVVNLTYQNLLEMDGPIDVELIEDIECFTWTQPIETVEQLEEAVNY